MKITRRVMVISAISLGVVIIFIYYTVRYYRRHPDKLPESIISSTRSILKVNEDLCVNNVIYQRGDEICLWGHANPSPSTDIERSRSSYNGGYIRIDEHPFLYHPNGVMKIHRHWWQFSRTHFFTRGYTMHPGHFFIQTNEGLHYISSNSSRMLTTDIYDRLIFYENVPYVLKSGRIYKCMNEMAFNTSQFILRTNQWELESISFIGGFDIRFIDVIDMSCAKNDELIIVTSTGRVLYIPTSKNSGLVNQRYLKSVLRGDSKYLNPFDDIRIDLKTDMREIVTKTKSRSWKRLPIRRICLGESVDDILIFYNHSISVIRHNRTLFSLDGVKDAVVQDDAVYVVDLSGTLCEYSISEGIGSRRILCRHMNRIELVDDIILMISDGSIVSKLT